MDLEEWELLPDEGILEINDDGGKKIYSRKYPKECTSVLQMNYFTCPQKFIIPEKFVETSSKMATQQLLPVPFDLIPPCLKPQDHELALAEASAQIPVHEIKITKSQVAEKITPFKSVDQDQDLLNHTMEKEIRFVDIKVDSISEALRFDENGNSPTVEITTKKNQNINNNSNDKNMVLNLWKWSLTGVGAICSFGVAAASVCIIILSSNRKIQHNQKLQFQIYTNDKRIKQMVHHAMKLDEATRGVSVTRARITVDGYFDAVI